MDQGLWPIWPLIPGSPAFFGLFGTLTMQNGVLLMGALPSVLSIRMAQYRPRCYVSINVFLTFSLSQSACKVLLPEPHRTMLGKAIVIHLIGLILFDYPDRNGL